MKDLIVVLFFLVLCAVLVFIPTGYKSSFYEGSIHAKAEVLSVDNDDIQNLSVIQVGTQILRTRLLDGPHKGMEVKTINQLQGKKEIDEIYSRGDDVLVEYRFKGDKTTVYTRGHYRLEVEIILAVLFAVFLVLVAGFTGFKALMYSGFAHLNLTSIFVSGIIIACSGAVMDLAMDIAASMHEIREKKPDIGYTEHVLSGMKVGRSVIGTMTTTLLLAYSGGYTTMLMYHMGQGTPPAQFFNINYIAAEILNVFVGSFGLVAVAPFTAITGGLIFKYKRRGKNKD